MIEQAIWQEGRDEAVYRGNSHNSVSNSERECFRKSPELYYQRFIAKTIPSERTTALEVGGGLHATVLLPEDDSIVEIPTSLLTKAGARNTRSKDWGKFVADQRSDARLLTPSECEQVYAMREAILSHPVAAEFLDGLGPEAREVPLKTFDVDCGMTLRCRLDALSESADGTPVIIDLKTTAADLGDLQSVAGHVERFGYHRQAAFYRRVTEAVLGTRRLPFLFIFVEKKPPYRVQVLELDHEWVAAGDDENLETLAAMALARETGEYRTPGITEVACLSRPRFAKYRDEYQLES